MIDPTALQQARLSIGQIRVCWPLLGPARTTRVSRPSVALSGRAAASRDADLRAAVTPTVATQELTSRETNVKRTAVHIRHRAALLHLAQATVAAGVLLITLGVTIHLGAPWTAGWGIGLLTAWGVLSVPLQPTRDRTP